MKFDWHKNNRKKNMSGHIFSNETRASTINLIFWCPNKHRAIPQFLAGCNQCIFSILPSSGTEQNFFRALDGGGGAPGVRQEGPGQKPRRVVGGFCCCFCVAPPSQKCP